MPPARQPRAPFPARVTGSPCAAPAASRPRCDRKVASEGVGQHRDGPRSRGASLRLRASHPRRAPFARRLRVASRRGRASRGAAAGFRRGGARGNRAGVGPAQCGSQASSRAMLLAAEPPAPNDGPLVRDLAGAPAQCAQAGAAVVVGLEARSHETFAFAASFHAVHPGRRPGRRPREAAALPGARLPGRLRLAAVLAALPAVPRPPARPGGACARPRAATVRLRGRYCVAGAAAGGAARRRRARASVGPRCSSRRVGGACLKALMPGALAACSARRARWMWPRCPAHARLCAFATSAGTPATPRGVCAPGGQRFPRPPARYPHSRRSRASRAALLRPAQVQQTVRAARRARARHASASARARKAAAAPLSC